jgi:serine/threonine protein kinase
MLALKVHVRDLLSSEKREVELRRVEQQKAIGRHSCESLIQIIDGGVFEDRLFVLMEKARGVELAKCLDRVPREKIRTIVSRIADAVTFLDSHQLCHRDIKAENIFVADNFDHVTLLDLSVARQITDPLGLGTDQDGQLPIVATARYSPPEYLFRLLDPGPEQWHALNIYQLGCLLFDLITRTQIFQAEYTASKANRYRFAWIVATVDPVVDSPDVPLDLQILARRALDKDWRRRSRLTVRDFSDDSRQLRANALSVIGIGRPPPKDDVQSVESTIQSVSQRFREIAGAVEKLITTALRDTGITSEHTVTPNRARGECLLRWKWKVESADHEIVQVVYSANLRLASPAEGGSINVALDLKYGEADNARNASIELRPERISAGVEESISLAIRECLGELALRALGAQPEETK